MHTRGMMYCQYLLYFVNIYFVICNFDIKCTDVTKIKNFHKEDDAHPIHNTGPPLMNVYNFEYNSYSI